MRNAAKCLGAAVAVLLASCGGGGGSYDGPPQIRIASPVEGQRITGGVRTITVTGKGQGLDAVEVRLNGVAVLPEAVTSTSTGFSATVELADNANTIEAIATNERGTVSSGVVNVAYPFVRLTTFQEASVVLGQADFVSGAKNRGGTPTASTLSAPGASVVAGGKLFVADALNGRVLAYDPMPTTNGMAADLVLGQSSFTAVAMGRSSTEYSGPSSLAATADKLLVKDDNRVLVFDAVPGASGVPADVVIGQDDFVSAVSGCAANRLSGATSIFEVDGKLLVADRANNRVLIWNTIPTSSGTPADLVLGQTSFTSCLEDAGANDAHASGLFEPWGMWSDGERLVVVDGGNSRLLVWNTFPTRNGEPADVAFGAADLNGTQSAAGRLQAVSVTSNGNQLFVSSYSRVLIWNSFPTATGYALPDVILGQGDYAHSTMNDDDQNNTPDAAPTARTLASPRGLTIWGDRLLVADTNNNRVLIFDGQ